MPWGVSVQGWVNGWVHVNTNVANRVDDPSGEVKSRSSSGHGSVHGSSDVTGIHSGEHSHVDGVRPGQRRRSSIGNNTSKTRAASPRRTSENDDSDRGQWRHRRSRSGRREGGGEDVPNTRTQYHGGVARHGRLSASSRLMRASSPGPLSRLRRRQSDGNSSAPRRSLHTWGKSESSGITAIDSTAESEGNERHDRALSREAETTKPMIPVAERRVPHRGTGGIHGAMAPSPSFDQADAASQHSKQNSVSSAGDSTGPLQWVAGFFGANQQQQVPAVAAEIQPHHYHLLGSARMGQYANQVGSTPRSQLPVSGHELQALNAFGLVAPGTAAVAQGAGGDSTLPPETMLLLYQQQHLLPAPREWENFLQGENLKELMEFFRNPHHPWNENEPVGKRDVDKTASKGSSEPPSGVNSAHATSGVTDPVGARVGGMEGNVNMEGKQLKGQRSAQCCETCEVLEEYLVALQADVEYLREVAYRAEVQPHGEAEGASGVSEDATTKSSLSTARKKKQPDVGLVAPNSTSHPASFAEASRRLNELGARHKRQVEQMSKETARWQNDMHLRLTKLSIKCRDLSEEADVWKHEASTLKKHIDEVAKERDELATELTTLRARLRLSQEQERETKELRERFLRLENEMLDKKEEALRERDDVISGLMVRLKRSLEALEIEREQNRQRRQIIFPPPRAQTQQHQQQRLSDRTMGATEGDNISELKEQLAKAQAATVYAQKELEDAKEVAAQREASLLRRIEELSRDAS